MIPGLIAAVPLFINMLSNNFFAALILSLLSMGVVMMSTKVLLLPLVRLIYKPNGRKETPENPRFSEHYILKSY